jgi:proline racemase
MAALHARGKLGLNADFVHEGILGTVFTGRLLEGTTVGPHRTVVPTITGRAWITGLAQYVLEADHPSLLHPPRRTCQSSVVSATSLWEC